MRMNRWQWLDRSKSWVYRKNIQKPARPKAQKKTWIILGIACAARTKSEARALAKKYFGLKRRDRLPVGTVAQLAEERRAA